MIPNDDQVDADFIGMWMLEEYEKVVLESGSDGIAYEACSASTWRARASPAGSPRTDVG